MTHVLIVSLFPLLMVFAAIGDYMTMKIPNWLNLSLAGTFLIMAFLAGMPLETFGMHVAAGVLALVVGFGLFALGYVGGGDAKLIAAAAMWLGMGELLPFLIVMALAGGALALVMKFWWLIRLETDLKTGDRLKRFFKSSIDLPYGIAIAAGALMVFPETWWFKGAATAALG